MFFYVRQIEVSWKDPLGFELPVCGSPLVQRFNASDDVNALKKSEDYVTHLNNEKRWISWGTWRNSRLIGNYSLTVVRRKGQEIFAIWNEGRTKKEYS